MDTDDPNALFYLEAWSTTADLNSQIRSEQYTRLLALMEQGAEPPEFRLSWISEVKGLEYLAATRLVAPDAQFD